jgi:hypothetical protein
VLAWGFSKSCSGSHSGQGVILKIAQFINPHKMISQSEIVFKTIAGVPLAFQLCAQSNYTTIKEDENYVKLYKEK